MQLTPEEIQRNNYFSRIAYEEKKEMILDYESDSEKGTRLKDRECKSCYYLRKRKGGFKSNIEYQCENCESTHDWHNDDTPKYCRKCCDKYKVCKRCGANL